MLDRTTTVGRLRDLYGLVLLLLIALAGTVLAQNAGQGAGEDTKPAGWATSANAPVTTPTTTPAVIATSQSSPRALPPDARLPVPDDALTPPIPTTPKGQGDKETRRQGDKETAPVQRGSPALPLSPPPPTDIQRTGFVAPASTGPTRTNSPEGAKEGSPGQRPGGETPRPGMETQRPGWGQPPGSPRRPGASTLSLTVEGPAELAPGQMGNFTVIARNLGTEVLAGVQVELPVPGTARLFGSEPAAERKGNRLAWNLGNLEGGVERRMRVDLGAGETGEMHLCPTGTFTAAIGLRTRVARPPFEVTVSGPETATKGSRVPWRIQIANHGTIPLTHVTLICRLSEGLQHAQGGNIQTDVPNGLAPGQVYTIDLPVQASQPGQQVLSLSASADGGRKAEAQGTVKVNEVTLNLAMQGPATVRVGDELAYRLEVSNPGNDPTGTIRLTESLPEGLEFRSAGLGGIHDPVSHSIVWTLAGLPGHHRHDVTFQVRARQGGDWALAGAVQADGTAEVRAAQAIRISAPPSLTVDLVAPDEPLTQGSEAVCEVRVRNLGTAAVGGVRLRMVLPDCLLAVEASAPTRWQIQGQQVLFEPIEQMIPRVAGVYRIRVRGVSQGAGRLRIEATAEGLSKPIEQERTCRVQSLAPAR